MSKFGFLVKNSLFKKLKSKAFMISQIIMVIVIMAIAIIPSVVSTWSEKKSTSELNVIVYADYRDHNIHGYIGEEWKKIVELPINSDFARREMKITTASGAYTKETFWKTNDYDIFISFNGSKLAETKDVKYYSKIIDSKINEILESIISSAKIKLLDVENNTITVHPEGDISNPGTSEFVTGLTVGIFSIIMMLITFSMQSLGAEILEEKATKAIEIIISSVPAETHFLSKIVSNIIFVIIQILVLMLAGIIGLVIGTLISGTATTTSLPESIPVSNLAVSLIFGVIGALVGVVLYMVITGFLASLASNNEDYSKSQAPIIIILLVGFYAALSLAIADQYAILKWITFIPFITPLSLPAALLFGAMTIWEGLIALLILIGSVVGLIFLITPAYRVSILSFNEDGLIKGISRSFKASRQTKKSRKK